MIGFTFERMIDQSDDELPLHDTRKGWHVDR
jgi:hypothetical protein